MDINTTKTRRRLFKNVSYLFVLQTANYIVPFITISYLAHVIGAEKLGLLIFAQSLVQYFLLATEYGFNLSATREISISRDSSSSLGSIFCSVISAKLLISVLGAIVLAVLIIFIPKFKKDGLVYFIYYISIFGQALFPRWLLQGLERMKAITLINVGSRVASIIAVIIFVKSVEDYLLAAVFYSIGWLAAGVIGFIYGLFLIGKDIYIPSFKEIYDQLKKGWHVFLSMISISLYTNTITVIVGLFLGNKAVAYYSSSDKLIRAIQALFNPIAETIYPHLNTVAVKSKERAEAVLRKLLKYSSVISFGVSVMVFFSAEFIIKIVFGAEFAPAVPVLKILSLIPFIVTVSNVLGTQAMLTFDMSKKLSRVYITGGIFNLAVIFPLIYILSVRGAAVSLVLTEALVVFLMYLSLESENIHLLKKP